MARPRPASHNDPMRDDHASLRHVRVGGSSFWGRRLTPLQWRPLLENQGDAAAALDVLRAVELDWSAVQWPDGGPASAHGRADDLPATVARDLLPEFCGPWLDEAELAELAALEEHLRSSRDYPGLDCRQCRALGEQGEGEPDCRSCPRTPPPPGCQTAMELFRLAVSLPAVLRGPLLARLLRDAVTRRPWALAWQLALLGRMEAPGGRSADTECLS